MDRKDIFKRLVPLCQSAFSNPDLVVTEELDSTMVDTWTSLSFMRLLNDVEKDFGIKFKIMELLNIRSIGDLVAVIASHQ